MTTNCCSLILFSCHMQVAQLALFISGTFSWLDSTCAMASDNGKSPRTTQHLLSPDTVTTEVIYSITATAPWLWLWGQWTEDLIKPNQRWDKTRLFLWVQFCFCWVWSFIFWDKEAVKLVYAFIFFWMIKKRCKNISCHKILWVYFVYVCWTK